MDVGARREISTSTCTCTCTCTLQAENMQCSSRQEGDGGEKTTTKTYNSREHEAARPPTPQQRLEDALRRAANMRCFFEKEALYAP